MTDALRLAEIVATDEIRCAEGVARGTPHEEDERTLYEVAEDHLEFMRGRLRAGETTLASVRGAIEWLINLLEDAADFDQCDHPFERLVRFRTGGPRTQEEWSSWDEDWPWTLGPAESCVVYEAGEAITKLEAALEKIDAALARNREAP